MRGPEPGTADPGEPEQSATVPGPDLRYQEIGEFFGRIGVELIVTVAGDQGESLATGGHADSDAAGRVAWWGEPQLR